MSLITDDELAWARECLAAGDTIGEVAIADGRPLAAWREALGQPAPAKRGPKCGHAAALVDARNAEIRRLFAAGVLPGQIALKHGLSRSTVYKIAGEA